jgi:Fe-S-cluster containining protein
MAIDTGPIQYLDDETFSFACHPGLTCFNECCRDLKLVLTPYDILRLKKHLGLSSMDFLDRYVDIETGAHNNFPGVFLKMNQDQGRTCPFVTPAGCRVYPDRPGACRIYPLGRGSSKTKGQPATRELFFTIRENHCRGFEEPRSWSAETWMGDQGLVPYNYFNDLWMEIITHKGSLGAEETISKKLQMFFMASYNLDQFRQFVLKTRFLERFEVPETLERPIREDDEALLRLALQWLPFAFWGEPTLKLKEDATGKGE